MLQVHFWATSKNKICPSKQIYCSQLLISYLWRQSLAWVLHIKELLVLNRVGFSFQDTKQPFPQHSRVVLHTATCCMFGKRREKKKTTQNTNHIGFWMHWKDIRPDSPISSSCFALLWQCKTAVKLVYPGLAKPMDTLHHQSTKKSGLSTVSS